MSDPAIPPRETVTVIRSESNGPLYLLVALIALGAVGVVYWVTNSHWHPGPTSTTTVIMPAPTSGPAPASGDVRPSSDHQPPDNRPRDSAPAPQGQH
jgi:hypothetical protein